MSQRATRAVVLATIIVAGSPLWSCKRFQSASRAASTPDEPIAAALIGDNLWVSAPAATQSARTCLGPNASSCAMDNDQVFTPRQPTLRSPDRAFFNIGPTTLTPGSVIAVKSLGDANAELVRATVMFKEAPTGTATTPNCAAMPTLASRLSVTDIDAGADVFKGSITHNLVGFRNHAGAAKMSIGVRPDSSLRVGWQESNGTIHVTSLNASMAKTGDFTLASSRLYDLVALADGVAVLHQNSGGMYLARFDEAGKQLFNTRLINQGTDPFHFGRVATNGTTIGAYFGIWRVFDKRHEGDTMRMVDMSGRLVSGGWDWGCSHNMDVRLGVSGTTYVPVCVSDAYPSTGIWVNHRTQQIANEWGDRSGGTSAHFGGLADLPDRFALAYSSNNGRANWDIAFVSFARVTPFKVQTRQQWISQTPENEANVKLAAYGADQLLLSWYATSSKKTFVQLISPEAAPIGQPEELPNLRGLPHDEFEVAPNGDVLLAFPSQNPRALSIARVRYCR